MKKLFGALLSLCLILSLSVPVMAADYTYKVRIYAGAQGTIGGQEMVAYEGLSYGSVITFNPNSVTLTNSEKYYVKGIRESGSDNSNAVRAFVVTGDMDYVVAYGIQGEAVAYTVNYQDQNGNTLMPSETFYGSIGDRPVIAFQYIEGYQPQAYNLTGTLSENASENVFTFVYTPLTTPATASPSPATASPTATQTPAENGEDNPEIEGVDDEGTIAPIEILDPEVPLVGPENDEGNENRTDNLIDVDENQVPLASATQLVKEFAKRLNDVPAAGKAGIVSGVVLLLGVVWWLMFYRRRKRI